MNRALAQQSSDPTAANALWESVDRRLADAAPAVPLFNRQHLTLVSKEWRTCGTTRYGECFMTSSG